MIDTGASHYIVFYEFVRNLIIKPEPLRETLVVETPFRKLLEVHVVYIIRKVKVLGRELIVDLILLDFLDFDVILGMDL